MFHQPRFLTFELRKNPDFFRQKNGITDTLMDIKYDVNNNHIVFVSTNYLCPFEFKHLAGFAFLLATNKNENEYHNLIIVPHLNFIKGYRLSFLFVLSER
jgi:hypothetical protein